MGEIQKHAVKLDSLQYNSHSGSYLQTRKCFQAIVPI